ncbi:MAG TPA: hypothetical protein VEQ66_06035 [Propionibacteriaceae bacterium]|nr:hypothetical protein [Propionibacteriaceae bacterium]
MTITSQHPRRWALAAAAGVSLSLGVSGFPAAVAAPAVSTPQATSATGSAGPLAIGKAATFRHLKVTVTKSDRKSDSYFHGVKVKVCVTSLPKGTTNLRLSWDPWTITAGTSTVRPGNFEEGADPWADAHAPQSKTYRVGQCMSGIVAFAVGGTDNVTKVGYANSLGNRASWKVTNGASPQRALGSTATFGHFTVKVTQTRQDERGFRAYATTCVRSLPPGSTGGKTRLSWGPFVAHAGTHFAFAPLVHDASHTWDDLYRQDGRYRVGQCVQGWVPFEGVDQSLPVDRLTYRNSLGDVAFWTAAR